MNFYSLCYYLFIWIILESEEEEILIEARKSAAARAIRISRALNLPIHYIKDGKLIEELPYGSIRIIKDIPRVVSKG